MHHTVELCLLYSTIHDCKSFLLYRQAGHTICASQINLSYGTLLFSKLMLRFKILSSVPLKGDNLKNYLIINTGNQASKTGGLHLHSDLALRLDARTMFQVRLGSDLLQQIEIKRYISILSCLGSAIFHKTAAFFLLEDAGTTSFQLFSNINSASHCHIPIDQNLQQRCGKQKPRIDVIHCFLSSYVHDSVYSHQDKQQNEWQ